MSLAKSSDADTRARRGIDAENDPFTSVQRQSQLGISMPGEFCDERPPESDEERFVSGRDGSGPVSRAFGATHEKLTLGVCKIDIICNFMERV